MKKEIRSLCETGILIALAVLLDFLFKLIPFLDMPFGGSVSLAMFPIMVIGFRNGLKWGIIGGVCYAVINFILDGIYWHAGSIAFDYLIAFGVLGLTGLFNKKTLGNVILGIVVVCLLRYVSHCLSGIIFFSEYAEGYNVLYYSCILYNGPYMLGSMILCILAALPTYKLIYKNK